MLTPMQLFFFVLIILYGLYMIVCRICKCIEHTANAKAFTKYTESGANVNKISEDFMKKFNRKL